MIEATAPADADQLLSQKDAARLLGIAERTLENWRRRDTDGPTFVRISRRCVRYRRGDLIAFIEDRTRRSTSAG